MAANDINAPKPTRPSSMGLSWMLYVRSEKIPCIALVVEANAVKNWLPKNNDDKRRNILCKRCIIFLRANLWYY